MSANKKSGKSGPEDTSKSGAGGFSERERAAMKERAEELKKQSQRGTGSQKDGEADVLAKIAEMPESERQMAMRIHEIIEESAPELSPRTWYGMPAYARDRKVVCFFQGATKFEARYSSLGFNDTANLDDGDMWPTSYAIEELTPAVEKAVAELVKKAVS